MLRRALRAGFRAAFVLADAWFGCKENIACCLDINLTALFQMKRSLLTYRYRGRDLHGLSVVWVGPAPDAARQPPGPVQDRQPDRESQSAKPIPANPPAGWRSVWSSALRCGPPPPTPGLSSSARTSNLSETKILEVYALRWSIEVYFKEIKQNLGFLKEQSGRYQLAYASVHLAALRYLLLFEAMLRAGQLSYGEIRDRESGRLQTLTYAALLWQLFRALIEGALEGLVRDLGRKVVKKVLAAIDQTRGGLSRGGPANQPGTSSRTIEGGRVRLLVTVFGSQLSPKCQVQCL